MSETAFRAALAGTYSRLQERKQVTIMERERELTMGISAEETNFRMIVDGEIGVKEIERLFRRLELDKEISLEQDASKKTGST